jgi:hypothetical protein
LAQASLLLLLMSFSSGFFAAIWPIIPDSRNLPWTGMLRCVCCLNSVKHLFGLQSEVQLTRTRNQNRLRLCTIVHTFILSPHTNGDNDTQVKISKQTLIQLY